MSFISQIIVETADSSTNWTLNGWGWFALALVNAGLAEQKNRSRLAWFLGSLVLGPIATALIVMMARPADDPVEPLRPFTDKADRYFSLAGVISILTLGVALLTLLGTTWYHWVGGAAAASVGVALSVVCVVRYQRARSESRAAAREAASQAPEPSQTETRN
ncbi:hypothetical protein [Cryobacterium frigoriphilum]|uniref:hypothetical protein n=1 Tax=Cryobacterium frigoriphilum TaxID=1259150 RepID=UPI001580C32D|nr:hypothetical protein [Cryobacterium frigoriphilum]